MVILSVLFLALAIPLAIRPHDRGDWLLENVLVVFAAVVFWFIRDRFVFSRLSYTLKANWKNVVDNYLECYHCTPAHPAFVDLVDIKNYRTITHSIYSSHISPPGRADNTAYCLLPGQEGNFAGFWLWPNMTFNSFPGCPNIGILHIMPTGPETTLEHFDFFFGEGVPDKTIDEAIA